MGAMHVAFSITRPKYFSVPDQLAFPTLSTAYNPWEKFPSSMVISGGNGSKLSIGSMKRKFEELIATNATKNSTLDTVRGASTPLAFYKEELLGGSPNATIPLLVRA